MTKNLFDDAIGEVPPSTVDVDAVIARGRRAELVHRAVTPVLATVAAVAVLLGGVAVALLSSENDGGLGPAAPTTTSATPTKSSAAASAAPTNQSPCADSLPTAPPVADRPAAIAQRLTVALTDATQQRLAPGAQLTENPGARYGGVQHGPLEFYHVFSELKETPTGCEGGEDYYLTYAGVESSAGTGNILAMVARGGGTNGGGDLECGDPAVTGGQTYCHRQVTERGDVVVQTTLEFEGGATVHRIDVNRADGTVLVMHAENVAGSVKTGTPATSPEPPLTHAQLTDIALGPGMTMYPPG